MKRFIQNHKLVVIVTIALVAALAGAGYISYIRSRTPDAPAQAQDEPAPAEPEPAADSIRFIAGGDMLPHDSVNANALRNDTYDYGQFYSEISKYFTASDLRFCNQEAPSAGGTLGISGYPSFNAPEQFARSLSELGCNVVSLANNHLNDKGQQGIDLTLEMWDRLKPTVIAGANRSTEEQNRERIFELKGVKFAFLSFAEFSNNRNGTAYGVNILSETLVREQMGRVRGKADIVIVGVHWGTEYSSSINPAQERWAGLLSSEGADIIIGTGPHVLQPVQRLPRSDGRETLVWYSLGNLLSTQLETESLIGGLAIMDIDPSVKRVTDVRFLPTYMHYEWTPEQKAREDLMSRRNLKIFPLDQAAEPLSRSLHATTVDRQTERVRSLLNTYSPVTVISSPEY